MNLPIPYFDISFWQDLLVKQSLSAFLIVSPVPEKQG
jgi:hypothetical protein